MDRELKAKAFELEQAAVDFSQLASKNPQDGSANTIMLLAGFYVVAAGLYRIADEIRNK